MGSYWAGLMRRRMSFGSIVFIILSVSARIIIAMMMMIIGRKFDRIRMLDVTGRVTPIYSGTDLGVGFKRQTGAQRRDVGQCGLREGDGL